MYTAQNIDNTYYLALYKQFANPALGQLSTNMIQVMDPALKGNKAIMEWSFEIHY